MRFIILTVTLLLLFVMNLYFGSVAISAADVTDILLGHDGDYGAARFIVTGSRLPQAVTALLAGAGLAVSGLMLQTAFRNPLAGPSILGINSGASLGVAIVMLFLGGTISAGGYSVGGYVAVMAAAFAGSMLIMGLLLLFSSWLKNDLMLLITGIMVGYMTSSVISLLNYMSSADGVQSYVMWGMGNFNGVSLSRLPLFALITLAGIVMALLLKTVEHNTPWLQLCAQSRHKHASCAQPPFTCHRIAYSRYHGLLRAYIIHRPCRASHSPIAIPHRQSPGADAGHPDLRRNRGARMQSCVRAA